MSPLLVGRKIPVAIAAILILSSMAVFLPVALGASPPGTVWFTSIPHDQSEMYGASYFEQCGDRGFILIGGYTYVCGGTQDAGVLTKLESDGALDWQTKYGGATMVFYDVKELSGGSFIVVGDASYEYLGGPRNLTLMEFSGEFAIVMAGFAAAALIGLVYMVPAATLGFIGLKRLRRGTNLPGALRVLRLIAIPWVASIALIALAELLMAPFLMMAATLAFVAITILLVVSTTSLWLARLCQKG